MPRRFFLPALLLPLILGGCTPPGGVRELNFRAGPAGGEPSAARLLTDQVVPEGRLVSVAEALDWAPEGSLILVCGRRWRPASPWGVCPHVSRKVAPGFLTEAPGLFAGGLLNGGPQTVPQTRLASRDAVIVLDVGVRPEQMPALRAEAAWLDGLAYRVGGGDDPDPRDGLDCSTYQNALQRAVGLPNAIPKHGAWNLYLPQDALTVPGVRVLWVGVRGKG
ncbi:hypothetical protein DAETH_14030 [Deinococcus aetherius]|uniref:Lipoprotein n=1 Tax=Deinococcus aetherius TaxID=200252 RepID=A0ABN6REY0_9DEIO|nr:hypothetical protein [Deinococcus aetherius]BDP41434.1 hypothetical protein DAETH_14030 [Deinococcus aetherius]